jgi:hypothetical protein
MDVGPEGEVKYMCSVYYVRLEMFFFIVLGIVRTSVKPRVSTSGFRPFVIETVELGLIIRMLLFDGDMFGDLNDEISAE